MLSSTGILLKVGDAQLPGEGGRASPMHHPKLPQLHHTQLSVHHVQTADEMCKNVLNLH